MKSKLIIAMIAIMIFAMAGESYGQFYYGLKAGGTLATQAQVGTLWDNSGLRQGFNLGAFGGYSFNESLSVQTELRFQEKGMRYDYMNNEGSFRVLRKYDYVNIPVLLKGSLTEKSGLPQSWSIYAYTGPYAGIQVYSKDLFTNGHPQETSGISDTSASPDFGAVLGAGVSKKISNGHEIFFEISYEMGLVKIDNQNPDNRNKAAEASIGFRF